MEKIIRIVTSFVLSAALFTATSCQKETEEKVLPLEQQLLTAKTWQVEEVSTTQGGATTVTYKRGALNNEDDFSMVRQSFKANGSITYVDSFGESGTNGRYQLMKNDQMQLSLGSLSTIVFGVTIRENSFSYKQEIQGGIMEFAFSPVQ